MFHGEKWEGTYEIEEITCDSSSVMSGRTSFSTSFSGSTEVSKYLSAVKEFQKLTENLENLSKMGTGKWQEVVEQAHKALQTAMAKLEEEFVHIIVQNNKLIDPEHVSLCLTQGHATNDESARDDQIQKQILGGGSEKYDGINLVHPDVVLDLRSIADMMFALNYGKQVSTAFTRVRKEALDECLTILGIKEFNTKDALQMGQDLFGQKLMVWIAAVKFVTQVYLPREKQLCNMIFRKFVSMTEDFSVAEDCFLGISAPQMGHLLNLGE